MSKYNYMYIKFGCSIKWFLVKKLLIENANQSSPQSDFHFTKNAIQNKPQRPKKKEIFCSNGVPNRGTCSLYEKLFTHIKAVQ